MQQVWTMLRLFRTAFFLVGVLSLSPWLMAQQKMFTPQLIELAFVPLKVEEAERQARGTVKVENAIPAQEQVFPDEKSWHTFWDKYGGRAPKVDFNKNQVAAVFLGPASPGHEVEIRKITYDLHKKLIIIHVTELLPNPEKTYPTVVVYPSAIVVFSKEPGEVEFTHTKRTRTD